ncbi:MAG: 2-oxoacid:acceptor oxidoreductase family protein [Bacteroidetes bacterium]|nr:2-oxoacid:acceptor oxidoreductase family protein [Bacteroidota bacterium]
MPHNNTTKILIAGVGGQGIVYLSDILVEASLLAGIPTGVSEIHGLSQRGGTVTSSITFGKNSYGFIEEGGADFLIGLEPLEAIRCNNLLHGESVAVIDVKRIIPYAVNTGSVPYPDTGRFIEYLKENIRKVIRIKDDLPGIEPVMRNIIVLGVTASQKKFPVDSRFIDKIVGKISPEHLKYFRDAVNNPLTYSYFGKSKN